MEIKYCLNCKKIFTEEKKCSFCNESLTLMDENFLIGQELGKYKIISFIGEGGMGAVFKGIHSTLKKPVAIKILIPSKLDTSFLKRFKKEAEVMALLKHPNIVEIYDYDISDFGFPYIVMEYLEGHSLRIEITNNPQGIPFPFFKYYIKQISSGLSYAHKKGVVHRDLKPENIFISFIGEQKILKILDFGIAKVLFSTDETEVLTKTNTIVGTPQYLSPEQIMGKEITPKSDQYTLTLIAYEMLTGIPVRQGKTFGEIVSSVSTKDVELEKIDFGNLPEEISQNLKKATDKNPSKRFENLEEFEKALIYEEEIGEKPTTAISIKKTKKKFPIFALPAFFLVIFAIAIFFGLKKHPSLKEEEFSFLGEYPVPLDMGSFLTSGEGFFCFEGKGCIYFFCEDLKKEPLKVLFSSGEKILQGAENGGVLILRDGKFYLKKYFLEEKLKEEEREFLSGIPDFSNISFSPNLSYFSSYFEEKLKIFKVREKNFEEIFSFDLKNQRFKSFKCGNRYLAYVVEDFLLIFDLKEKKELYKIPVETSNFYSMAFFEEEDLFAIGGWFDQIYIYDLKDGSKKFNVSFPGKTFSLNFIRNFPSLIIAKGDKILIWKFNENIFIKFEKKDKEFNAAYLTAFGILGIERVENKIYLFSLKDFFIYKKYKISDRSIWGMDSMGGGDFVYAGSSTGTLYCINLRKDKIKEIGIHTQGITSVVYFKENLITASDDKTIAVWKIPDMSVYYRTEAHNWLINYLYLNEEKGNLWSSSSDGFVKGLSLPGLKVLEEIKTGPYSNAAFWINEKENKLSLGTWNNSFLYFEKEEGVWSLKKSFKVFSEAIYSMVLIPSENLLVMAGINPYVLYVFLLEEKRLFDLNIQNSGINWVVMGDEKSIYAVGNSHFYHISFEGNKKRARVSSLINTDLKICSVTSFLKEKKFFALGTSEGEVFIINLRDLKLPEGYLMPFEKEILP